MIYIYLVFWILAVQSRVLDQQLRTLGAGEKCRLSGPTHCGVRASTFTGSRGWVRTGKFGKQSCRAYRGGLRGLGEVAQAEVGLASFLPWSPLNKAVPTALPGLSYRCPGLGPLGKPRSPSQPGCGRRALHLASPFHGRA